jgi:hypothetical protein
LVFRQAEITGIKRMGWGPSDLLRILQVTILGYCPVKPIQRQKDTLVGK